MASKTNNIDFRDFAEKYISGQSISGQDEVAAQLKKEGKKAYRTAIESPTILVFMADRGLIDLLDIDKYLVDISWTEYPIVIRRLLQYKSNPPEVQAKKASASKENETEQLKKEWVTSKMPDGTLMLKSYKGTAKTVVIPESIGKAKVSTVGEFALSPVKIRKTDERFKVRHCIKKIVISEGVTKIESQAFDNCSRLEEIILPRSLVSIGDYAFSHCHSLEKVGFSTINENLEPDENKADSQIQLKSIGSCAFYECQKLKEFDIPETVTSIKDRAFYNCFKLNSIILPKSLEELGEFAFYGAPFHTFTEWPENVKNVTAKVYHGRGIKSFKIPEGIEQISSYAFHYWVELKKITLPNSIGSIGAYAFSACCDLKEICIPNQVETIEEGTFSGCRSLEKITIPKTVNNIFDGKIFKDEMYPFWNCEKLTIYTPAGSFAEQYANDHGIPVVNIKE